MIKAILTLSGIGLLASLGLGLAARKFAVQRNPLMERVEAALPGVNCGACGWPGCAAYAKAVVEEGAPVNLCIPGAQETTRLVSEIMGVEASEAESRVAVLLCSGGRYQTKTKFEYHGVSDCKAAVIISGGDKSCIYGCLGLGTCESVCPFGAIGVDAENIPVVDEEKCTGCGICVKNCPKSVLILAPRGVSVHVRCHSHDKAGKVKQVCTVGCIGCGSCVRVCPYDALSLDEGLAVMDYTRCQQCGLCVDQCPTHNITRLMKGQPKAHIDPDQCVGSAICEAACPVDAISGDSGKTHVVDEDRCIGCRICCSLCPVGAVSMVNEE